MTTRVTVGARQERYEKRETSTSTRKARENGLSRSSVFGVKTEVLTSQASET